MKWMLPLFYCLITNAAFSQTLQLHYDARHSLDPAHNAHNFESLYFEYFKNQDSGKGFIKPGSFLLKVQTDYNGAGHNINQIYLQVSQTFRFWQPKVFVNLQYNGGLGVTEPRQYSYYLTNTYSLGAAYPFRWGKAYLSGVLNYRYTSYTKPSHDVLGTLYWYKGLCNYKAELAGDFSVWTENKNHGDDYTKQFRGKRFSFFAEPQFWHYLKGTFSVGTKVNMYYHVLTTDSRFQVYPTLGIKCKL